MKKITTYIIIFGIISGLSSCIFGNRKRDFKIYKLPILIKNNNIPIKVNGVYIPEKGYGHPFFFFKDGSIVWKGWASDFRQNRIRDMKDTQFHKIYSSKEYWGHYSISYDTIFIQAFNRNSEYLYKRWIFEFIAVIQNDTSFLLLSEFSYQGKYQFIDQPIQYHFYHTDIKPDSTKAWFNNKKWFKENLHESRKAKN